MNERTDLDRLLTAWLTADAPIREPEPLLGQVLARTARTRRRSAWRIPERWFPVSTITTRVAGASRFPWRTVAAVALLVLALAVGAVFIVGSRAKPVPAPFGPAGNGQIRVLGQRRHRRHRFAWCRAPDDPRWTDGGLGSGVLARRPEVPLRPGPDGEQQRRVVGGRCRRLEADDGSPRFPTSDGSNGRRKRTSIAVSIDGDQSVIRMVATDGSGSTDIKTGLQVAENPIFRPSDGQQMTFRGQAADGTWGIYLIGRDGTNMQRLDLDPGFTTDAFYAENSDFYFQGPAWSPDGGEADVLHARARPIVARGTRFPDPLAMCQPAGAVTADREPRIRPRGRRRVRPPPGCPRGMGSSSSPSRIRSIGCSPPICRPASRRATSAWSAATTSGRRCRPMADRSCCRSRRDVGSAIVLRARSGDAHIDPGHRRPMTRLAADRAMT